MITRSITLLVTCFLFAGCAGDEGKDVTPADADTDADSDADTDTDVDADSDADADTDCKAVEVCDGIDSDCDGNLGPMETDADGDGVLDCMACDAAGFYGSTERLTGAALEAELRVLTAAHTCVDYSAAREFMFSTLDNVNGSVQCVYTERWKSGITGIPNGNEMNTEHTWPQSQGADNTPMRCDLHHLFPTESQANSYRSNLPFGVVTSTVSTNGYALAPAKLGDESGGDRVFEPPASHKGHVARSAFYFRMRYTNADTSQMLTPARVTMMKQWSRDFPPDAREIKRSIDIGVEQGAANPFVLCPYLVDQL